ncbi:MAG: divalent metal cation transporter [Candidatus Pacebacteria bacterium]|nr:divalent metal cation transporter [Candidatus Paceibacterota bacterium]
MKDKYILIEEDEEHIEIERETLITKTRKYFNSIGPGVITGAADDDPSGIATYSQAGAQYGSKLIWMSAWTLPLVATVQEMCARIALVTGRGLASNIKKNFSKKILYISTILLLIANTFNIGADIGAMAKSIELIYPNLDFNFLVVSIGLLILALEIIIPYKKYVKYLKWFVVSLFAYILTGLIIHMDWGNLIFNTIVPHISFNKDEIILITAILGTTISPYLFFWQTSEEIEEEIAEGKKNLRERMITNKDEIKKMRKDVWSGMFISNLVMFFIIAVCANTLFIHGVNNITTASDAAKALTPLVGNFSTILFTIGIVGTGLLAIPILAGSTAYAISESFGWKEGLYRKYNSAHAFYSVIIFSIIIGIAINFININPVKALIYSAVLNGLVAPIILIFIVKISSSEKIMGEYKNNIITKLLGWLIILFMTITGIFTIYSLFF